MQYAAAQMQGRKEGKTLGMIVVGVGEEQRRHDGLLIGPPLGDQFLAQANDARASVYDDQVWASTDFQTGGVAAKSDRRRPRFGVPPAHAPKGHRECLL